MGHERMSVEREKPRQDKAAVVDLSARQKPSSPSELHGHLKLCLKSTLSRLEPALARLFENVDDALFDLAEKADSNALQTNYFDGMRHVRKKRQDCERIFRESMHNRFSRFAHGRLQPPTTGNPSDDDSGELSLVGDQELEESLAIAGIVSKIESHSARDMYGLNERFSLLAGGQKVEDDLNPVGAAHITDAFHKAADELSVELPVKLIIYKLFDKYVASQLPALYQQLNKQLSDAGVLPNLKPSLPGAGRRGSGYSAPMPGAMAGDAETPTATEYDEPYADQAAAEQVAPAQGSSHGAGPAMAPPPDARIFHGLRKLLAGYRGTTPPPPLQSSSSAQAQQSPASGAVAGDSGYTDLMNALSILQGELLQAEDEAAASQPSGPISKARILTQMKKLGGTPARVGGDAEDTIDLVSMLFDFILKDKNLAPQIQAVLSRLQLPYVKVALLDRQMFAQKSHPARKLLDELAHAGIGWSEETDQDNRLLRKIEGIVERLLTEFDDDISVFSNALDEFRDFMSKMERRAQAAERRTAEASKGREKLLTARKRAAKEVLGRLKDRDVPPLIHDILTRPWANVLVLIYLRQGDESEQWQKALDTADQLLWSGEPKSTDEDQRRLIDIRADLEQDLRQGLELVAYHETDIQEIIKRLDKCHIGLLEAGRDAKPAESAKPTPDVGEFKAPSDQAQDTTEAVKTEPAADQVENQTAAAQTQGDGEDSADIREAAEQLSQAKEEIATAVSELAAEIEEVSDQLSDQEDQTLPEPKHSPMSGFVEEIVMESGDVGEGTETALEEDEFVELARSLEVGAWLEFTEDDGTVLRAKLSWISPISHNYLFVNRRGLKVADKTVFGLAAELRRETARIVKDVPLFDRALGAIVKKLSSKGDNS